MSGVISLQEIKVGGEVGLGHPGPVMTSEAKLGKWKAKSLSWKVKSDVAHNQVVSTRGHVVQWGQASDKLRAIWCNYFVRSSCVIQESQPVTSKSSYVTGRTLALFSFKEAT